MGQEDYKRLERRLGDRQVVMEFPKRAEGEGMIRKEVKEMLAGILQEYLEKKEADARGIPGQPSDIGNGGLGMERPAGREER